MTKRTCRLAVANAKMHDGSPLILEDHMGQPAIESHPIAGIGLNQAQRLRNIFGFALDLGSAPSVSFTGILDFFTRLSAAADFRNGSFSTDRRCLRDVRFPPDRYRIAALRQVT